MDPYNYNNQHWSNNEDQNESSLYENNYNEVKRLKEVCFIYISHVLSTKIHA